MYSTVHCTLTVYSIQWSRKLPLLEIKFCWLEAILFIVTVIDYIYIYTVVQRGLLTFPAPSAEIGFSNIFYIFAFKKKRNFLPHTILTALKAN